MKPCHCGLQRLDHTTPDAILCLIEAVRDLERTISRIEVGK